MIRSGRSSRSSRSSVFFCAFGASMLCLSIACGGSDSGDDSSAVTGGAGAGGTGGSDAAGAGGSAGTGGGAAGTGGSGTGGGSAGTGGGAAGTGGTGTGGAGGSGTGGSGTGGAGGGGGTGGAKPTTADFSCVGSVVPEKPTSATVTFQFKVIDATTQKGIASVAVRACAKADTTCAAPLSNGVTDAMGAAMLTVPTGTAGFDGYVEVSDPKLVPQLAFLPNAVTSSSYSYSTVALTTNTFNLVQTILKLKADASRGHVGVVSYDCKNVAAPGVSIAVSTSDAQSTSAYFVNMVPMTSATETDASGFGLVANVPVGPTTVTATVNALGKPMGKPEIFVRAGTISALALQPLP